MERKTVANKKIFLLMVFLLLAAGQVFAQTDNGLDALKTALGTILGFFTSGYMKAILTIALAGLGAGMLFNRGDGVWKKFLPWFAACVILLAASGITGMVFSSKGGPAIEADYSNLGQ